MSRTLPTGMAAALASGSVELFYGVEMLFDSGALRFWTGYGDRSINGHTYTGAGALLNIDGIAEVADLSAVGITVTLSGISSSIISLALQENYQGRVARVYFGVNGIEDAVEVFSGLMDVMVIQHGGETMTVDLSIESKLVTLQRANLRRYTRQNHILRHPGDTFFNYVTKLQDKEVVWGHAASSAGSGGNANNGGNAGSGRQNDDYSNRGP